MLTRVLLCGVGGQGTILAAHILAQVVMEAGFDVKVSEIHGMSQRGGSVSTVVTYGDDVTSMVCGKHSADFIVSFDKLEALRNIEFLKPGGLIISDEHIVKPASVLTGKSELPNNFDDCLASCRTVVLPVRELALKAGNAKTSNMVLLGAYSCELEIDLEIWKRVISKLVPEKTISANLSAFELGVNFRAEAVSEQ